MATAVKSRPNFYEVLGLTPAATNAEIGDAFAREIILSRMRAFGGTAHVSIAYETLRDPAKRKAYDESIGIRREPPPAPILPRAVSFRSSAHFIGAPPPAERTSPTPEAKVEEPPVVKASQPEWPVARAPEPARESRIAPFIAASLRRQEEAAPPVPAPERKPAHLPRTLVQPRGAKPIDEAIEESRFDLRRPAVIGGAVIAAVAVIGAWAGIQAGNEVEAADTSPATNQVTVTVPKATTTVSEPAADVAQVLPSRDYRRRVPVVAARREQPARAPAEPKRAVTASSQTGPFDSEPVMAAAATVPEPPAEETRLVEAAAKNLPLSHAAIAQTIRRIGYPCGQVASTSQILGGMYRVTCTSGDSYRAAPVNGRYRFKRLGSH